MTSKLVKATKKDTQFIIECLICMDQDIYGDELSQETLENYKTSITNCLANNKSVHWFIFKDENNTPFGTCHMQSVYNYWRVKKRFYMGGFYIKPEYRGNGRFKDINKQLKNWVAQNDGIQIYCHIDQSNQQSTRAFNSVDFASDDYILYFNHWES